VTRRAKKDLTGEYMNPVWVAMGSAFKADHRNRFAVLRSRILHLIDAVDWETSEGFRPEATERQRKTAEQARELKNLLRSIPLFIGSSRGGK
jgi:hypothetical protein